MRTDDDGKGAEIERIEDESVRLKLPMPYSSKTYRIKFDNETLFVIVANCELNVGTPHAESRPYSLFLQSKDAGQQMWLTALARVISAGWMKGGEYTYIVEDLVNIVGSQGGMWGVGIDQVLQGVPLEKRVSRWIPSLVSELGKVLEHHFREYCGKGVIESSSGDKEKEFEEPPPLANVEEKQKFMQCRSCNMMGVVHQGGCDVCVLCGHSERCTG